MRQVVHPDCGNARGKHDAQGRQHDDDGEIPTQLVPMNIERSFKKERREQRGEDEVLGKADLRRERQDRQNDPCRNQADAVREAKSPGQHCDDRGDQKQQRSGLKIEFHVFRGRCRFYSLD